MTVNDIKVALKAKVFCCEESLSKEVLTVCGSDLMSDVLAFVKDRPVLLTGIVNSQVIRTAEMMDIICVVFVRGKEPPKDVIDLACEKDICLLSTQHRMFTACGILYENGLRGGEEED